MLNKLFSKNNKRIIGDFRVDKYLFKSNEFNMGWYEYKITHLPTNTTFKGDTEYKLTENFVGIYKKGNKENLLKKMENLKTRHPKKIIVEWEEIVEKFRENEDYLNKAATPGTDIFLDWTRKGFDKELLTGFVDGPNIVNKRALAMIISEGVFGDRYEVSCVYVKNSKIRLVWI